MLAYAVPASGVDLSILHRVEIVFPLRWKTRQFSFHLVCSCPTVSILFGNVDGLRWQSISYSRQSPEWNRKCRVNLFQNGDPWG